MSRSEWLVPMIEDFPDAPMPKTNNKWEDKHRGSLRTCAPLSVSDSSPMHSSTLVCDGKFGQMWVSTETRASDEEQLVSGQSDPWKQLGPLILQAASKYPVYGVD